MNICGPGVDFGSEEEDEGAGFCGENSMLDWDWRASDQYGGQSVNLREWLGGIRSEARPKKNVCQACGNFDVTTAIHQRQTTFSERYSRWDKRSGVGKLREAAEQGCKRCEVLVQALHYLGPGGKIGDVNLKFLPTSVAMFNALTYLEIFPSEGEPSRACGFPPGVGNGRKRYADLRDSDCYGEITMAINDCILNHPDCRPSANSARPNRLVEIPAEDGIPIQILHAPVDVEYAALSHCWGTEPLRRLLKADGAGEVSVAWGDLPKSFRDACAVARSLFLQYIWIDSLCIVQDDSDDWEREAAKMGTIYEGAYVTISATDAAASVDGFLFQRYTTHSFTAIDEKERQIKFTVRDYNIDMFNSKFPHYGDTVNHPWLMRANDMDEKYLNPLQLRGWCFQERLMAKRVLHFKRYEVILECSAGYRCECSGMRDLRKGTLKTYLSLAMCEYLTDIERLRLSKLQDQLYHDLGRTKAAPGERVAVRFDGRLMQAWEILIEIYTRTSLTFQEDVFPALGSLARVFHAKRPDWHYMGGLWKEELRRSLLWIPHSSKGGDGSIAIRKKKPSPNSPSPLGKVAPSFSWASISGRVRYMSAEYGGVAEFGIVSTEMVPSGTDPYGDLVSGSLVLRGRMVAFRFRKYKITEENQQGLGEISIEVHENDWNDAFCTRSRQDVEICTDITTETLKWAITTKVESGVETLETVKGFDTPEEYSDFFDEGEINEDEVDAEEME